MKVTIHLSSVSFGHIQFCAAEQMSVGDGFALVLPGSECMYVYASGVSPDTGSSPGPGCFNEDADGQ